jgi:hypothetical protein
MIGAIMAYNYFHCSRHNPLTRYAAAQPNNMPGVYATPSCATCGKPMQFYGTGTSPTDTSAVPPPLPQPYVVPKAQTAANTVYDGTGMNPGHGRVTWKISQNEAMLSMTVDLKLGEYVGGSYSSEQKFKMIDGLLDIKQGGEKQNWWLKSPTPPFRDAPDVWHRIRLRDLVDVAALNKPPEVMDMGVKLGNAAFGMIHFLAGHAASLKKIGEFTVMKGEQLAQDDQLYVTMLSVQSGMGRFETNAIQQINYDAVNDKFLIAGSNSGLIVLQGDHQGGRYSVTTTYNTSAGIKSFGDKIYPA